eukprot:GFUD01022105.1.p1 GENE.GFUD01022105.1~~GFUD01022105.1.p1  ORF type:complete len:160 (-),score=32.05 GFUD01022105.1:211-666(-)
MASDRLCTALVPAAGVILACLVTTTIQAGGDCMTGNTINCFDCNSWDDPRCHDPWNWTYPKTGMPDTSPCTGCCVKMVSYIGTDHYQIRRTCSEHFEVNFFMVNHACMTEGHRHGRMCFCEEDECNGVETISSHHLMIPAIMSVLVLRHSS